jgi:hypothetical protein
MVLCSEPPAGAAEPRGVEANIQHVLAQSTRLPTTVDQTRLTGADDERPVALSATLVSTGPLVDARVASTLLVTARPLAPKVVRALTVGATLTGQSMEGPGASLSWVTVKMTLVPLV